MWPPYEKPSLPPGIPAFMLPPPDLGKPLKKGWRNPPNTKTKKQKARK